VDHNRNCNQDQDWDTAADR